MGEQDGIFGGDGVQLLFGREFFVGPQCVIPSAASDPVAFFVLGNGGGDAFLQFFDSWHVVKLNGKHVGASAAEVNVRVVEPGHDEATCELDGLGAFVAAAAFQHDLFQTADAGNFTFANRHRG